MKVPPSNEVVPWNLPALDRRPVIIAVAGPNGAGKSTFYEAHLRPVGLRFLNADILAGELQLEAYQAAEVAAALRRELVNLKESFIFETVFSDPVGEKVAFLKDAASRGYSVVLCFIGIGDADRSGERVAMRVSQGGHDVPTEKMVAVFPRTMANLKLAIRELPTVVIFDNDDIATPFRLVALFQNGRRTYSALPAPGWVPQEGSRV